MAYSRRRRNTRRMATSRQYSANRPNPTTGGRYVIANGTGRTKKWWSCSGPTITSDCRDVTDQVNMNSYMNGRNSVK
tara:strand:- start:565 stop:795 length:231 start_codon:yes stop_codon:yes gene_type:complete